MMKNFWSSWREKLVTCTQWGDSGKDVLVIREPARMALDGDSTWTFAILNLLDTLDSYIPESQQE